MVLRCRRRRRRRVLPPRPVEHLWRCSSSVSVCAAGHALICGVGVWPAWCPLCRVTIHLYLYLSIYIHVVYSTADLAPDIATLAKRVMGIAYFVCLMLKCKCNHCNTPLVLLEVQAQQ